MNSNNDERLKDLLRKAVPPSEGLPDTARDLWPLMVHRMDEKASLGTRSVPWFDWALGGALLALAAIAPRSIPVILYYL
jgi:hypothetical protein